MAWAIPVAMGAGSLAAGLLSNNSKGNNGSPAQIVTTSPYDQMMQGGQGGNFNDLANTNSTYLADMYSQLGTGQAPSYYQNYQNQAMPYQQNLLNQQFYGNPGNRMQNGQGGPSGAGNVATMASMFGMNPKATTGLYNKNNLAYQNASSALDQYFAGQGLNTIQNAAQSLPGMATQQQNSLTQAFEPHTNMIPAVAAQQSQLPGLLGALSQNGAFTGGLSQMFSSMFNGLQGGGSGIGTLASGGGINYGSGLASILAGGSGGAAGLASAAAAA